MTRRSLVSAVVAAAASLGAAAGDVAAKDAPYPNAARLTASDFTLTGIDGTPLPLRQFAGKAILLVNTASFCGFTPQYEGLQALYDRYRARGLVVVGVPSGDFLGQEHKANKDIKTFCETRFNISFPMAEKAHVKGSKALPVYQWARTVLGKDGVPGWNFHKLLIGRDGRLVAGYGSRTTPQDKTLVAAVERALAP